VIPLKVAILWHQHQPLYRSAGTGRYSLPWVRLHGLKDYYDMAELASEFPRLRLTFNLVPSLLEQIDDYVSGEAIDPVVELARRRPEDLDEAERLLMLDLFFSVPYRTLIAPYPRYAALYHRRGPKRGAGSYRDALPRFSAGDLRDLQVWFHLAWCGPALRRRGEVRELLRKSHGFTEEEKTALLSILQEFLGEVIPIHRRLRDEGIAELSASPYYHPILPLLCDLGVAREAVADLPLPGLPYAHPGDAAAQVREAVASHAARFGAPPAGMWPSEGGLSRQTVAILGECGIRWAASDEGVLRASVSNGDDPALIYRPWRLETAGDGSPTLFFRDRKLSDLIGFTYASWRPERAVADFLSRLRQIARQAPGGVVSVILDGENAWEYYPDNGAPFLRALYAGLTGADDLETVTFSGAMAAAGEPGRLDGLRAGSWIGADFTTWIGHPEKNRAWELLAAARSAVEEKLGHGPGPRPFTAEPVWRTLAAAQGSDWFWWLGDDHASEQDAVFDASFRDLIRASYRMVGLEPPREVDEPIKRTRVPSWSLPTGRIRPALDGRISDYFEWLGAGVCEAGAVQGAMHEASGLIRRVAFGTDGASLFVRVDPDRGDLAGLLASVAGARLTVCLSAPRPVELAFGLVSGRPACLDGTTRFGAGRLLEVEIPLEAAGPAELYVALSGTEGLVQRLPREGAITFSPEEPPDWSV